MVPPPRSGGQAPRVYRTIMQWGEILMNKISAITNIYLIILSIVPFAILAIGFDNPRYVTISLIWVGTIFLIEPSMILKAFREINEFRGLKEKEDGTEITGMYEYFVVLGGTFLIIVGMVTTFIVYN